MLVAAVVTMLRVFTNFTAFSLAYYCENWKFKGVPCKTNTAVNAHVRAPGNLI
jgi:hypothetical protein